FAVAALLLVITVVARLIHTRPSVETYVSLMLPAAGVTGLLLWNEAKAHSRTDGDRFIALLQMLVPFGAGFVAPVLLFIIPFARAHALSSLFDGVFILPLKRVGPAYRSLPEIITILPTLLCTTLVTMSAFVSNAAKKALILCTVGLWAALLITSARSRVSYQVIWLTANWMIVSLTVIGIIAVGRVMQRKVAASRSDGQQLFLLISVASLCNLVQFPFAAPIYFCYVAPLFI